MNKEGVERAGVEPPRTPVVGAMCTALQATGGADVNGGEALRGRVEETVEEEDVDVEVASSEEPCGVRRSSRCTSRPARFTCESEDEVEDEVEEEEEEEEDEYHEGEGWY